MQVVFISNYINHHQLPFCNAMYRKLGNDFIFIQSEPMEEERKNMGWSVDVKEIPYLKCLYDDRELCKQLILDADVVIAGWTNAINLVIERMEAHKLTIRISERIYREGQWKAVSPRGLVAKRKEHGKFRKDPVYLLCAGAYVPSDFKIINSYPNKMFKFGYFPETRSYRFDELLEMKDKNGIVEIIFAGRFLKLKHPEYMVYLARDLLLENEKRKKKSMQLLPDFRIHMVGEGELENELKDMVLKYGLSKNVLFYGFQTPDRVRAVMERCHIHVFPSNELEGWGAVVNEAMNSGCAVVASARAGAVPYLITQWENGVAYPDNDYKKMKNAVRYLMVHANEREAMARCAYKTIKEEWNCEVASDRLLEMIGSFIEGKEGKSFQSGPLSKAEVVAPSKMFRYMEGKGIKKDSNV